jgi:hypothetical protein
MKELFRFKALLFLNQKKRTDGMAQVVAHLLRKQKFQSSTPNANNKIYSQTPVAHTYNPSYSGGRDQEDSSLKPTQANSSQNTISKKSITKKKSCWSDSTCRP